MKDIQHKVNIYNLKDIDQNSCSFRLPESFVRQVEAETVYISDLKNKARDAIEELEKLSKYIDVMKTPDEYFAHMQGHETELSLVLSAFSLNDMKETIIQALEKQIPKRVNKASENKLNTNLCPVCSREVRIGQFYCETCGQKLNWD